MIAGTAGHIDHGKTALIKALTGTDADRLPEEKRRGITVDLGFAEMSSGDLEVGFVDVPGHERFVKNMLAGASGIDLVMLVIASDEGVMPQTREHFDICRLLGLSCGLIVLTKIDLVDEETLELARLDAIELVTGSFLGHAPIVGVSSRTGEGIEELKVAIGEVATQIPARGDRLIARLPIDRSFSMKGFGAVVTGTLVSGKIVEGAEMELLPSGARVRVRGIQSHGRSRGSVSAGQRAAINVGGIDHAKITRGMVLAEPDVLRPTQAIDAEVEVLPGAPRPLRNRQRVRVHIGTVEALARLSVLNGSGEIPAGEKDLVQIRLEKPVAAAAGEAFILRSYSPQVTIAGGRVIDVLAERHSRKDLDGVRTHLHALQAAGDDAQIVGLLVDAGGRSGQAFSDLQARTALRRDVLADALLKAIDTGKIVDAGGVYIARGEFERLIGAVETAVESFHDREPLAKGITREALRELVFAFLPPEVFQTVVTRLEAAGRVVLENETVRLASYRPTLSSADAEVGTRLLAIYSVARLAVPKLEDALAQAIAGTRTDRGEARKIFQLFLDSREIVKVTDEFYFAREVIDELASRLRQYAAASADRLIDVPAFKELAGISRKYAIPLLEYFDRERVTRRAGDRRLILE